MTTGNYLLLVNLYLVLFYGFYVLMLRKETFFQLNRSYLLGSTLLSFLIPVLQADWLQAFFVTKQVQQTLPSLNPVLLYTFYQAPEESLTVIDVLSFIYLGGVVVASLRLLYKLVLLRKAWNKDSHNVAFSFFNQVKVSAALPQQEVIKAHEQVHVQQWHSADVLFFEILAVVLWFNPVIYLYKSSIKSLHEFIADQLTVQQTICKADYALLLLQHSMGMSSPLLVNQFFNQSLLKSRIMMLGKKRSGYLALWKYTLSGPLFAGMMILSSATMPRSSTFQTIAQETDVLFNQPASDMGLTFASKPDSETRSAAELPQKNYQVTSALHLSVSKNQVPVKKVEKGAAPMSSKTTSEFVQESAVTVQDTTRKVTGKVSNVRISTSTTTSNSVTTDTTARTSFRISSLNKNGEESLYVINGVIYEGPEAKQQIEKIDAKDISSINVLKDKKGRQVYGSKGKNGVIEITMKQL